MLGETYNHQNPTTTTTNGTMSSIALLQERFRQLQKMKEMRQEKELIRFLSESSDRYSPPITQTPPYNNMLSSQVLFVSADHPELTLSLWPGSQIKKPNHSQSAFNVRKSWFADAPAGLACGSMVMHERGDTDIDTSLHL